MLKVRPLDKWTAFAVVNHYALLQGHATSFGKVIEIHTAFDAYDAVTGYYSGRAFSLDDSAFNGLARYVYEKLRDAIPVFGLQNMPDTDPPEHILFIVVLFSSKGVPNRMANLRYVFTKSPFKTGVAGGQYSENMLQWATPLLFGNTAVIDELRNGNDKRFTDIRNDPLLQRFIKGRRPASQVEPQEAKSAAQNLIRVSNERSRMIPHPDNSPVGLTCDCALLDTATGFRWLDRNHSLRRHSTAPGPAVPSGGSSP